MADTALPFIQHSIVCLAQGDHAGALRAASEACHIAPQLPQAHYAYGQALTALGDHPQAEQAFATALQLEPNWADAWVSYGVERYRQSDTDAAIVAMRQALLRDPGHAAAMGNLGAFLRITGGIDEAEALLRDHLQRQPDAIGSRLNLVADLLQSERSQDALALLDAVPPPADPASFRHWSLQRSQALLQRNDAPGARQTLAALLSRGPLPAALQPLLLWRHVLLALAEGDPVRARGYAEQMEAALDSAVLPEHAIMAQYDLAKFWSGQQAHVRAFAHWQNAHAQLRQSQPFSRPGHRAFVDAGIAHFNKARLHDGPRAGNTDPAPIFIVGMPRSGTTLIEQILGAHRDAHAAGERPALGQMFASLGGTPERVAAHDAESLDRAAADYLAALHAIAPDKARIVDKLPGNFLHLGLVATMLPGARIIHCVRDPRDIGLSIFTFRFHGVHAYAHDLGDLGWYIGEHDRLMAHWHAALPSPILTVKLSDWVDDFDATLDRVLTHVGLPPDPNCARFYENDSPVRTVSRTQVRQPVNARGLGRWHAYAAALAPLTAELQGAGSLEKWHATKQDHNNILGA